MRAMSERVIISIYDGIADVRFNRSDKRNACSIGDVPRDRRGRRAAQAEPGVRVVVLSGDGPSFCAGLDCLVPVDR